MKGPIILSISSVENGRLNVHARGESLSVNFQMKSSNIFLILLRVNYELFTAWFGTKFSRFFNRDA